MSDDARSEFERIFGATQRAGETKPEDGAVRGATQRLPSDSDVLGIRTDSDRFVVRNVPERLPIDPKKDAASPPANPEVSQGSVIEPVKSSPDAMTIALNVNVFANLADTKGGDGKPAGSAEGPTFVIPLPKPSIKAPSEANGVPAGTVTADRGAARSQTETEFTRILHVQDAITVPKPAQTASESSPALISTEAKAQPSPARPIDTSSSGPSDFTKVVKGSELRAIQERLAANTNAPGMAPHAPQPWQPTSGPAVPQYVPSTWPTPHPTPHTNAPAHPQSKLSQYMPLIIALNVLFVLAILLIVFFAVKK